MTKSYTITPDDTDAWDAFVSLYTEAFPDCERRPIEAVERLTREEERFRVNAIKNADENFTGFLTSWDFDRFAYIEHFAVAPEMRGGGTGGKILDKFIAECGKPVILEAETATDEMSSRRLGFYARHGFAICRQPYKQPPYTSEYEPLPMHLLSFGRALDDNEFADIRDTIYETVYNTVEK